jgi:hypothetical protein
LLAQQRKEELRIEALVQLHDPLLENIRNDQGEEGGRGDGERKTEVEREEESEEQTDQIFYWDTSASETDTESESDAMDMMTDFEPDSETENQPVNESSSNGIGMQGGEPTGAVPDLPTRGKEKRLKHWKVRRRNHAIL